MYTFNDVIGNENIIDNLKNAVANDKVAHFYMIDGKEKMGKELIAKSFAKLLLCENSNTSPCLMCSSCLSFDTNNNPDFFFIGTDKNTIGINDIRDNIIENTKTKPFKYKYKVFVIKDAHKMTVQAQNVILKTVEEPPSFVVFIMLTKNYKLFLPTILSRCILFKIKPLPLKTIEKYLIDKGINKALVRFYSSYSFGSIGKAIEILEDDKMKVLREEITRDIESFEDIDIIELYNLIEKYEQKKDDIEKILDMYLLTYRDALIFKSINSFDSIIQKDINPIIRKLSNLTTKNLIKKIENIIKTKIDLKQNINFSISLECLFFKLKEKEND